MRRTSWIILVTLVLFFLGAAILWTATKSATPPFLTTAAPAFDTLVRAGNQIQDMNHSPSTNELPAYIATNAAARATIREALTQTFEAPAATYDMATINTPLNQVGSFKSLALLLKNEGLNYELQNKPAEAARSYTDVIRLGQKIETGPLMFMLIGIAIERIGIESLGKLDPNIPSPARSEIGTALRQINSQRVPFGAIEERERYIRRRNSPTPLHFLFFSRQSRAYIANAQNKYEPA
ncbi:MAG: hypothetical protein ACXW32_11100, partial [Limisphaerales bacterium]